MIDKYCVSMDLDAVGMEARVSDGKLYILGTEQQWREFHDSIRECISEFGESDESHV